jgi:isoquinoline 1-oxidoreductase beta subunit
MMLIAAAAALWKVPAAECTASEGVITHKASGRTTTFGRVADAAAQIEPPAEIKLKDPKDWKLIGKGVKRLDTLPKVKGEAIYGIDVKLPGMLSAAIAACPVFGDTIKSFDAAKVMNMRCVKKVVQVEDDAVAVIADTWWNAKTALEALPIEWNLGAKAEVTSASIAEFLKGGLDAEQAVVGKQGGDVRAALARAAKKHEAVYAYPYQHHVTMEPQNATALYTPEKCEVWASVQDGEQGLAAASEASGIPVQKCEFYKTFLGGGFGRRSTSLDYVRQAVLIAKESPAYR